MLKNFVLKKTEKIVLKKFRVKKFRVKKISC